MQRSRDQQDQSSQLICSCTYVVAGQLANVREDTNVFNSYGAMQNACDGRVCVWCDMCQCGATFGLVQQSDVIPQAVISASL
jgi:hypothetical protein